MSALFPLLQLTPSHVTGTETARPIACLPAPTLSPYKFLSTIVILRNRRTGRATILLQYVKGPQTCVPCTGGWILNHWTTREISELFLNVFLPEGFLHGCLTGCLEGFQTLPDFHCPGL